MPLSPSARARQKQDTRLRLLDAAAEAYAEEGFGATADAVARRAGVSHGSVFAHFDSRQALLEATLARALDGLGREFHRLAGTADGLRPLLEAHLAVVAGREGLFRRLYAEGDGLPPATRSALVAFHSTLSHHFALALTAGAAQGQLRSLPPYLLFNTWLGLLAYYLQNADLFAPGGSLVQAQGGALADYFLQLVQKEETV